MILRNHRRVSSHTLTTTLCGPLSMPIRRSIQSTLCTLYQSCQFPPCGTLVRVRANMQVVLMSRYFYLSSPCGVQQVTYRHFRAESLLRTPVQTWQFKYLYSVLRTRRFGMHDSCAISIHIHPTETLFPLAARFHVHAGWPLAFS